MSRKTQQEARIATLEAKIAEARVKIEARKITEIDTLRKKVQDLQVREERIIQQILKTEELIAELSGQVNPQLLPAFNDDNLTAEDVL
jgi:chromosome segregation ATPase